MEATVFDPRAVSVMMEVGISISSKRSKSAEEFGDIIFDPAVTVCDRAREASPICGIDLELPSRAPNGAKGRPQEHRRSGRVLWVGGGTSRLPAGQGRD